MNLYRNADEAVADYYQRMSAASSPRSIDPYVMRGRVYAELCPNCGGDRWVRPEPEGAWRCGGFRCGQPRPWTEAAVPAGMFDMNPRPTDATQLDHLVTLGVIIDRAGLWERRVLGLLVIHRSYNSVATITRETWPRRLEGWSLYRIRQDVKAARRAIEAGLRRAGLLRDDLAA